MCFLVVSLEVEVGGGGGGLLETSKKHLVHWMMNSWLS